MIKFLQSGNKATKIVLGGLLVLICITMVITLIPGVGVGDFAGSGSKGTLAKVGDQEVTAIEVQNMERNLERRQYPRGIPDQFRPFLMQDVANNLILQKAMLVEANRMGLGVSDAELRDELRQGPIGQQLFPNGTFIGQDEYENFVAQNFGMTKAQFEQAVKTDLMIRKLRGAIAAGVAVSEEDVRKEFDKQHSKAKFEYAVLKPSDIEKQIKPTDAELKAFYDKNKARYENSNPEKRKAKYVLIDPAQMRVTARQQVTDADIQQYYQQHQDEYRIPEQVKVSHILIKTPPPGPDGKPDEKGVEAARKKAEDILKQLRAGGDFAELAKKNSDDPGSAKNGGSLGLIQRGRTVPEFEQAAFSQPVGKIGDLVKSTYGFHIIRVDEKQEARLKPLAEVRDSIAMTLASQKAASAIDALASKVQTQARTNGLDSAAAANHLNVVTSDWFGRSDSLPGIGAAPEFTNAAFSQQKNGPPEQAKLPSGGYAVFVVTDIKPASTPTYEEVKARVEQEFKQERVGQLLEQKTREIADRAHAQHDLAKAAKELGATVKTSDLISPTDSLPDLGPLGGNAELVFNLNVGEISNAIGVGGNGAVFKVLEKKQGTPEEFAAAKDAIRDQLLDRKRNERLQLFVTDLRARMEKAGKIKINKDEWSRVIQVKSSSTT